MDSTSSGAVVVSTVYRPVLSVVVAAYNEEAVILGNLGKIVEELERHPAVSAELICVNDGSRDRTGTLMDEFARDHPEVRVLHHRRNFGQGRALRTAFDACRGETIVCLDADLSYGPEYIFRLADALETENAEIALASPYMRGGSVRNVPVHRRLLSRAGNWYLARMSGHGVATSTCVVRAYRREVLDQLVLTSDGMELQLEVLMKASLMGFRVCEIPAELAWTNGKARKAGVRRTSKMRVLHTVRLYLLMGWLSRPAFAFVLLALLMLLSGGYVAVALVLRTAGAFLRHSSEGLLQAISSSLEEVFASHTYSVAFCGVTLVLGLQLFAFALLTLQNKFYFEEMYRLQQASGRRREANQAVAPRDTAATIRHAA
jgi:glycosyltransferase involved in cell wall biosynthesis